MSSDPPSCHSHPNDLPIKTASPGTIHLPSPAGHKLIMEDFGSRETVVTVDARQFSDKVPLTELHLCRYEECHKGKGPTNVESPLDPVKTRALYILLVLIVFWATVYISFAYFNLL